MNCRQVLQALDAGPVDDDGALTPEVVEHLRTCGSCNLAVSDHALVTEALGVLRFPSLPDGFTERVMRRSASVVEGRRRLLDRLIGWLGRSARDSRGLSWAAATLAAVVSLGLILAHRPRLAAVMVVPPSPSARSESPSALPGKVVASPVTASPTVRLARGASSSPLCPEVVEELCQALASGGRETRAQALKALEALGPRAVAAVGALVSCIDREDIELRTGAIRVLGHITPAAASIRPVLLTRLANPALPGLVRGWCAEALGRLHPQGTAVPRPLVEATEANDVDVAQGAAWGLGNAALRSPAVVAALRKAARRPHSSIQRAAFWALAQLGPAAAPAIPELIEGIASTDKEVRGEAAAAIRCLGTAGRAALDRLLTAPTPGRQDRYVLLQRLLEPHTVVAARQLQYGPRSEGSEWMDQVVPVAIGDHLDGILSSLDDPGSTSVPPVLAHGDRRAISAMVQRLAIPGPGFRRAAETLAAAPTLSPETLPALTDALGRRPDLEAELLQAISKVSPDARPALPAVRALLDRGPRDTAAVLEILRKAPDDSPGTLEFLVKKAVEPQPIGRAAARALAELGPRAAPALEQIRSSMAAHTEREEKGRLALVIGHIGPAAARLAPELVRQAAGIDAASLGYALSHLGPEVALSLARDLESLLGEASPTASPRKLPKNKEELCTKYLMSLWMCGRDAAGAVEILGRLVPRAKPDERPFLFATIAAAGDRGRPTLEALSRHESPDIRRFALIGLGLLASSSPEDVSRAIDAYLQLDISLPVPAVTELIRRAGARGAEVVQALFRDPSTRSAGADATQRRLGLAIAVAHLDERHAVADEFLSRLKSEPILRGVDPEIFRSQQVWASMLQSKGADFLAVMSFVLDPHIFKR